MATAVGVAALLGVLLTPAGTARPALPAPPGTDPLVAGAPYRGDFPDPAVVRVGKRWYAYATTTDGHHMPVLVSTDLRRWRVPTAGADAMPTLPTWAWADRRGTGMNWAPSVVKLGKGRFVAAYTVRVPGERLRMCLSLARSTKARGPFVDRRDAPLICPRRGAIDPQLYREKGRWWLLYKTDDNAVGKRARIWVQRINPRQGRLIGDRTRLLRAQRPWEGLVVENPSMIRFRGQHYLFYSGNGWGHRKYSVAYARCDSVKGPCRREGRLIRTNPLLAGPGGADAFKNRAGRLRLAYHAWDRGRRGYAVDAACRATAAGCPQRRLHIAHLRVLRDGRLEVGNLSR